MPAKALPERIRARTDLCGVTPMTQEFLRLGQA